MGYNISASASTGGAFVILSISGGLTDTIKQTMANERYLIDYNVASGVVFVKNRNITLLSITDATQVTTLNGAAFSGTLLDLYTALKSVT